MLYIISAGELARQDKKFLTANRRTKINAAMNFINRHIVEGKYISPAGERRGSIDAFYYPEPTTVTHIQGLLYIAQRWLSEMGFNISAKEINLSKEKYQDQAKYDYLPLSDTFPKATDATALYPDYLAITSFSESMITDTIAKNTYQALPWSKHGIKILTQSRQGEPFPYTQFIIDKRNGPYHSGFYQNAGVWLFWQNNSQVDAKLHGVPVPADFKQKNRQKLEETKWAESIVTGGEYENKLVYGRQNHVWNAAVIAHQDVLDK